jgi:nucleoside-diphosphate-sugar epimerase
MKICVVGGTGHISTAIVTVLLELGHEVTCFNRGRSGQLPPGVSLIRGDRQDRQAFERAMQAAHFDAAIDMVCFDGEDAASSVRAFQDVQHFVQCSTVCTYGIDSDWLPVTEDHPLRPITPYGRHKAEADDIFLTAYDRQGFPVTILKPSTTYGPQQGLLRQIGGDFSWIDRIRKGKPILVCDDGNARHQHLYVDDAASGFASVIGREHCRGHVYNLVDRGDISWADYHRAAMRVLGREVELVGVPLADLLTFEIPNFDLCREIFAHETYYSAEKLCRDVPEFRPSVGLEEGMRRVIAALDRGGRIPDSDRLEWEDRLIAAQRRV